MRLRMTPADVDDSDNNNIRGVAEQWVAKLSKEGRQLRHDHGVKQAVNLHVDEERLKVGREYFQANFFTLIVSMFLGLYSIIYVPSIARILSLTGQTDSKIKAYQRYYRTVEHAVSWFLGQFEMKQSLKKVLSLHRAASLKGEKAVGSGQERTNGWMSQFDMAVTQWGFIGPALVFTDQLAIHAKAGEKADGLVYVFYLVGKSLGVLDEFNLCSGSLAETKERCRMLLKQVIQPSLRDSTEEVRSLSAHLLNGINVLNPLINQEDFSVFSDRILLEEELDRPGQSSPMYNFYLLFFKNILLMPGNWILRMLLNCLLRYNFWLAGEWFDVIVENTEKEDSQNFADRFWQIYSIFRFSAISVSTLAYDKLRQRFSVILNKSGVGCGILVACLIIWCSSV